jgi:hypothetical protein
MLLRPLILRRLPFPVVGLSSAWVGERLGPCNSVDVIVGMNNGNVREPPSVSGTDLAWGEKTKIGSGEESCVCRSDQIGGPLFPPTFKRSSFTVFPSLQESQPAFSASGAPVFPAWENAGHPHAGPWPIRNPHPHPNLNLKPLLPEISGDANGEAPRRKPSRYPAEIFNGGMTKVHEVSFNVARPISRTGYAYMTWENEQPATIGEMACCPQLLRIWLCNRDPVWQTLRIS